MVHEIYTESLILATLFGYPFIFGVIISEIKLFMDFIFIQNRHITHDRDALHLGLACVRILQCVPKVSEGGAARHVWVDSDLMLFLFRLVLGVFC